MLGKMWIVHLLVAHSVHMTLHFSCRFRLEARTSPRRLSIGVVGAANSGMTNSSYCFKLTHKLSDPVMTEVVKNNIG